MHIEGITGDKQLPLQLGSLTSEALSKQLAKCETSGQAVVYLEADLTEFERVRSSLCLLRASNLSPILLLKPLDPPPTVAELEAVIPYLRDWDQLFLFNILVLFQGWLPPSFAKELELEAKIELKWFREWLVANQDARLSRYPGLPWRSYIRKVIGENYDFTLMLLRVGQPDESGQRDEMTLGNLLRSFLKSRKKAICFFPKKWGRSQ